MKLEEIFGQTTMCFSSFFLLSPDGTKDTFTYHNDTDYTETARAILFPSDGMQEGGASWKVIEKTLAPYEAFVLDTDEIATILPGVHFGSILLCLEIHGTSTRTIWRKEFVSNWISTKGGAFTSAGPYADLHTRSNPKKRSFFMFAPVVYKKGELNTMNILINHSTDPNYADAIDLVPQLSNLNGETIDGTTVHIFPFGCARIDLEDCFGKEGVLLLQKTGGYGTITVRHFGHVFVSYFFQTDEAGNILCGNHTQPPTGIFGGLTWASVIREQIKKVFPWSVYVKELIKGSVR